MDGVAHPPPPTQQGFFLMGKEEAVSVIEKWLAETYEHRTGSTLSRREVYDDYIAWCEQHRAETTAQSAFGKILHRVFPTLVSRRVGGKGKHVMCYQDFGRKDAAEGSSARQAPPEVGAAVATQAGSNPSPPPPTATQRPTSIPSTSASSGVQPSRRSTPLHRTAPAATKPRGSPVVLRANRASSPPTLGRTSSNNPQPRPGGSGEVPHFAGDARLMASYPPHASSDNPSQARDGALRASTGSAAKKRSWDSSGAFAHDTDIRHSVQPSARPEGFVGRGAGKRKEVVKEEGDEEEEMQEELEGERDHPSIDDLRTSGMMEQRCIMDPSAAVYRSDQLPLPTKGSPWIEYEIEKDINILTGGYSGLWHGPHGDPQLPEFTDAVPPALPTEMHPFGTRPDQFHGRVGFASESWDRSRHSASLAQLQTDHPWIICPFFLCLSFLRKGLTDRNELPLSPSFAQLTDYYLGGNLTEALKRLTTAREQVSRVFDVTELSVVWSLLCLAWWSYLLDEEQGYSKCVYYHALAQQMCVQMNVLPENGLSLAAHFSPLLIRLQPMSSTSSSAPPSALSPSFLPSSPLIHAPLSSAALSSHSLASSLHPQSSSIPLSTRSQPLSPTLPSSTTFPSLPSIITIKFSQELHACKTIKEQHNPTLPYAKLEGDLIQCLILALDFVLCDVPGPSAPHQAALSLAHHLLSLPPAVLVVCIFELSHKGVLLEMVIGGLVRWVDSGYIESLWQKLRIMRMVPVVARTMDLIRSCLHTN